MSLEQKIRAAVQAYFDLFNSGDSEGLAALFSDDASVIDPVGTKPKTGKKAIAAFYKTATEGKTKLEADGPVRVVDQSAAFGFRAVIDEIKPEDKAVDVDLPSGAMIIDIIDVFEFNAAGKIIQMRAYWGPSNIR